VVRVGIGDNVRDHCLALERLDDPPGARPQARVDQHVADKVRVDSAAGQERKLEDVVGNSREVHERSCAGPPCADPLKGAPGNSESIDSLLLRWERGRDAVRFRFAPQRH
jgi:hypothetical protein